MFINQNKAASLDQASAPRHVSRCRTRLREESLCLVLIFGFGVFGGSGCKEISLLVCVEEGRVFGAYGREKSLDCLSGVDDSGPGPAATAAAATTSALVGGSMRLFKELYVEIES